jgi:hypothetical protein
MSNHVRLHLIVEGATEERFVNKVLTPHLANHNVFCDARSVLTSKDKKAGRLYRGGLSDYARARTDIVTWIKQDHHEECRFSTMFDLYALPDNFPGFGEAKKRSDPYQRVAELEEALAGDIGNWQLIPYIQLHEFEALVLADPQKLNVQYLEHDKVIKQLATMVKEQGGNPELIDDGTDTAPSKRILRLIPQYDKATDGPEVAAVIGLQVLRTRCRHSNEWISQLEQLPVIAPGGA